MPTVTSTSKVVYYNALSAFRCGSTPPTYNAQAKVEYTVGTSKTTPEGHVDPYAFLKENGYLPVRPYKKSWSSGQTAVGMASWRQVPKSNGCVTSANAAVDWKIRNGFSPSPDVAHTSGSKTDPMFENLRNQALMRLNDKAKSVDAGLGETLAQGRQTLDMLTSTATRLYQAGKDVRAFRFAQAARRLGIGTPKRVSRRNSFSSNWLQYRYGWLPLLSDCYGAMKVAYDHYNRPIVRIVNAVTKLDIPSEQRSRVYSYENYLDGSLLVATPDKDYTSWAVDRTGVSQRLVRAGYVFEYSNGGISTLTSAGLGDPVLLAWELLPFSFIADWFVNMSDYLGQMTTFNGKTLKAHYITYVFRSRVSSVSRLIRGPRIGSTYASFDSSPSNHWFEQGWVEREVFSTPQAVQLQLANGLNPTRLLDAIALMRTVFAR